LLIDTPILTTEQVQQVERDVNEKIKNAIPVEVKVYEEGDETLSKVLLLIKNISVYV
jgi:alanyl-tRNA synthetase